jgi:hypothetical protein
VFVNAISLSEELEEDDQRSDLTLGCILQEIFTGHSLPILNRPTVNYLQFN